MNRRLFLKTSTIAGFGVSLFPQNLLFDSIEDTTYDELIGKGNPEVFGTGFKLRKEAYNAFLKLSAEALKSDINIQAVSSYRNFAHQNRIWERKYKQNRANGLAPQESIKKNY